MEINQLKQSFLKDSIRIAFLELGEIHYKYGFVNESIKAWIKSHDFSTSQEDLFKSAFHIAKAAFELQNPSYLFKYNSEAEARDPGTNKVSTNTIKILDGLAYLI